MLKEETVADINFRCFTVFLSFHESISPQIFSKLVIRESLCPQKFAKFLICESYCPQTLWHFGQTTKLKC